LEEVAFLVVAVDFDVVDEVGKHRAEGDDGVDAFGAEDVDALLAGLAGGGEGGDDEDFGERSGAAEGVGGAGKSFWAGKAEHLRRVGEHGLGEDLSVPRFHNHDGAGEVLEICGGFEHEGDFTFSAGATGIMHIKINFIVLALRRDVLALLAHEEAVQLEELADNGFANGHFGG